MNEETSFWLVQKVGGAAGTYRHPSKESATNEAIRLANRDVGEYFVLKAEAIVRRVTIQVVTLKEDDIPF